MFARFLAVFSAVALVVGLASAASLPAASALSSTSIVTKTVWRVGEPMPVRINYASGESCMVWVVGPASTRPVTLRPKRYRIITNLTMPAGPPGRYQVQVRCGREGARSRPFVLVGPASPLEASCRVTEQGLSRSDRDEVTYGAVLVNDSPDLSAVEVEISVISKDASGNVIETDTVDAWDIPPGGRVLVGDLYVDMPEGTRTYEAQTRCTTSIDSVPTPTPATGRVVSQAPDPELAGTFTNTMAYTVDDNSEVAIIVRGADGAIEGGDTDYPDSFVLPGGVGTWGSYMWSYRGPRIASVEAMVLLEPARS